jgi:hypothetical protein
MLYDEGIQLPRYSQPVHLGHGLDAACSKCLQRKQNLVQLALAPCNLLHDLVLSSSALQAHAQDLEAIHAI